MINGYSSLLMTKLDVLSGFEELPILLKNNEWKTIKGWDEDISKVRTFKELPRHAREYVDFVEEYLETPISWIGVGPERDAMIQRL